MKYHLLMTLLASMLVVCCNSDHGTPVSYSHEPVRLSSSPPDEEPAGEYKDGTYCAEVEYYYSKTGTHSTYTLLVDVENDELVKIHWPNGGWLDESHFLAPDISDGIAHFTSDRDVEYTVRIIGEEGDCFTSGYAEDEDDLIEKQEEREEEYRRQREEQEEEYRQRREEEEDEYRQRREEEEEKRKQEEGEERHNEEDPEYNIFALPK